MDDEIKKLLEKNLQLTQEVYKMTKSIKSFVIWQRIFGLLKILIIVVPIVLGIIYLPPLIKDLINQYQSILDIGSVVGDSNMSDLLKEGSSAQSLNLNNIDIDSLPPEIQKYLK